MNGRAAHLRFHMRSVPNAGTSAWTLGRLDRRMGTTSFRSERLSERLIALGETSNPAACRAATNRSRRGGSLPVGRATSRTARTPRANGERAAHDAADSFCAGVSQDIPIWENKIYCDPPVITRTEKLILEHRRCARQFYSDRVEPADPAEDPR
jgi:3-Ketosteroid 9alpha-hydroxylase C-terminal domain